MAKIHLGANCAHVHGVFHEYPRSMFQAEIGREGVLFYVLSFKAVFMCAILIWPYERCFKNLHPGANLLLLSRWCKFICTRVQIVHMNANRIFFIHFDWRVSFFGSMYANSPNFKTRVRLSLIFPSSAD